MSYLMAIDAGTGSIRAVIFDTNGNQISISQREWTHLSEDGVPDSMGFDFETNWTLACKCIKESIQKANIEPKEILSLSATSMREGIVLYDKDGNELWGVANVDARASNEVRFLKENFIGIEEEFYAISGQTFALGALPRLLWLKNNKPEIYKKVAKLSMIGDWVLYKLCGVIASDPSNGGTTGVFDLKQRDFAPYMAKKIGLKDDIFPACLEVGEVLGRVSKEASNQTMLSTSTKVVMGGGDVQLGCAGLGVVEKNQVAILGGSFWQQVINIDKNITPPKDMGLRVNPHVIDTLNQAEGITFFSGLIMRWFRDNFAKEEMQEAKKLGIDVYELLEQKASKVAVGSNGVLPIFSDVMRYGKWYHASPSFLNLDIQTTTKEVLFRALEENAAIVSAINLENAKKFSSAEFDEVVFAGGASKGNLWCQILSDVLGLKVKVPKVTEATALGGAMSAGVGAGVFANLQEASKKLVKWDKTYKPNMKNHDIYKEIKQKWQRAYEIQLKLVDEGVTKSMWKAPGL